MLVMLTSTGSEAIDDSNQNKTGDILHDKEQETKCAADGCGDDHLIVDSQATGKAVWK